MRQVLIAVSCLIASSLTVQAQPVSRIVEYPVKIICGPPNRPAVAQGFYFTAINIHNAGNSGVTFQYWISLTDTMETPGMVVADSPSLSLRPMHSLEIDCTSMTRKRRLPGFLKGFVIIRSTGPLDVVAVYTAAAKPDASVSVLEIERVPGRPADLFRPTASNCNLPDLVIARIARPYVLLAKGPTVDTVFVANIGSGMATASHTFLQDLTSPTLQGMSMQAVTPTLPINAGNTRPVLLMLPWPPAAGDHLEAYADYNNEVEECKEDNNTKMYAEP